MHNSGIKYYNMPCHNIASSKRIQKRKIDTSNSDHIFYGWKGFFPPFMDPLLTNKNYPRRAREECYDVFNSSTPDFPRHDSSDRRHGTSVPHFQPLSSHIQNWTRMIGSFVSSPLRSGVEYSSWLGNNQATIVNDSYSLILNWFFYGTFIVEKKWLWLFALQHERTHIT